MYGWKSKVGLILPSGNTITEPELNTLAPSGLSFHTARICLTSGDIRSVKESESDIDRCVGLLDDANVDLLVYACTVGSSLRPPEKIEEQIESTAEVATITTGGAIKRALSAMDIKTVAVTSPYVKELHQRELEFLEGCGYEVIAHRNLGAKTTEAMASYPTERVYREAREVNSADADAVLASCMNFRTFQMLPELERDLGKPVLSSNQATLWDIFRRLEISDYQVPLGALFDQT
jgi:maleate isomerase